MPSGKWRRWRTARRQTSTAHFEPDQSLHRVGIARMAGGLLARLRPPDAKVPRISADAAMVMRLPRTVPGGGPSVPSGLGYTHPRRHRRAF